MRSGLFILGLFLLVLGAALYFLIPGIDENLRYARDSADDTVTMGVIPFIGLIAMGLGLLLAVLGLFIPDSRARYEEYDDEPIERTRTVYKDEHGHTRRVETNEVKRER